MFIGEMEIKSEYVDNQIFYIPTIQQWEILLHVNPIINGKYLFSLSTKDSKSVIELAKPFLRFVNKYKSFSMAFYEIQLHRPWYFCLILRNENSWKRVNIGECTCRKCGWKGAIAEPSGTSLYVGSPEDKEAINRALNVPTVGFPICNNKLAGHIIWVDKEIFNK